MDLNLIDTSPPMQVNLQKLSLNWAADALEGNTLVKNERAEGSRFLNGK
jgi:hypothetical protein